MAILSPKMRIRANLIAFLVLGLGLSYLMATQVISVLGDQYSVRAVFPDAGGVFTNQEVTYRGVTVGQVGDLKVVEDGVEIELLIDAEHEIPAEDVEARVMFKSAVGEQFVDLLPGTDDPPYLEDGAMIPVEQTSIPVSTQELLTTLEGVLRGVPPDQLAGAIDALGEGLTGRGQDLAAIIRNSADLATLFAERAPEVEGILEKGTTFGRGALDNKEDFDAAIAELVEVSDALAESTPDLERLMRGTVLTSDEIVELISTNRSELNRLLVDLGKINEFQADHREDLNLLFIHLPDALAGIESSFETGTGLVRFGLVDDTENPACTYATERRPPEDRSFNLPPKEARCGGKDDQNASGAQAPGTGTAAEDEVATGGSGGPALPGLGSLLRDGAQGGQLPARMSS